MKIITKQFEIYNFEELREEIKEKVICDEIDFLMTMTDFEKINKNSNLYKAYKKSINLYTPWFLGQYILDFCNNEILKNVKKRLYYKNGNIYEG